MILKACATAIAGAVCLGSPSIGWFAYRVAYEVLGDKDIAELQGSIIGIFCAVIGFAVAIDIWKPSNDNKAD